MIAAAVGGGRSYRSVLYGLLASAPFVVLAWWNIWVPYSYWFDELYSVVISGLAWKNLFDALLGDVHPPLYQVVLKVWIGAFGSGEIPIRLLSAVFSTSAILILAFGLRRQPASLVVPTVVLVASTDLTLWHAQEARSYAMLLFLSSLAVVLLYRRSQAPSALAEHAMWYATLLALSLTHYFGLLLSVLLLLSDWPRGGNGRTIAGRFAIGLLMLAWPVFHMLHGHILARTGGRFWITTEGIHFPTRMALDAFFAAPIRGFEKLLPVGPTGSAVLVAGIVVLVVCLGLRLSAGDARRTLGRLSAVVLAFVAIVTLVDLHTPMSTPRNYIVLFPLVAVALGISGSALWEHSGRRSTRIGLVLLIVLYAGVSGQHALDRMEQRWTPIQNWKDLAITAESRGLCDPHCWFYDPWGTWRAMLYEVYFEGLMSEDPRSVTMGAERLGVLQPESGLPIIAGQVSPDELETLRATIPGLTCWQPRQVWANSVILLIDKQDDVHPLVPCDSR
jgi:hypothetical protein